MSLHGVRVAPWTEGATRYDRVVFEFGGDSVAGYSVAYADRVVRHCASGDVVTVQGMEHLLVRFAPAQAHDQGGNPTPAQRELVAGLPLVKELKLVCDFEGQVEWLADLSGKNWVILPKRLHEAFAAAARSLGLQKAAAGKTGTTNDFIDAWFCGYTVQIAACVWVGYPEGNIPMAGVTGGSIPAAIWHDFMVEAVVIEPWAAHPTDSAGYYARDLQHHAEYGHASRTHEGFEAYVDRWIRGTENHSEVRELLGIDVLRGLAQREDWW